jgi:diadenosine tetraphosphate (Ap4A) HIT family hydrolase
MAATLKQAQEQGIAPWDDLWQEERDCAIYLDRYPVTPGHLLFVPKINNRASIAATFQQAYRYGEWMVLRGDCDAFNIGMNRGAEAGQTVMYPHIHLIPRRKQDCEDPVGGVRGVIPNQANYKKPGYKNPTDK